jgi:Transcriptional regulator, AbiEi antitoxin
MPQENIKLRVARVAARQRGRISRAQLMALGIGDSTIRDWTRTGYLYRILPGVYAVGHADRSEEADLFSAVLYAGPGAALAGLTAGVWRGLVKWRTPPAIEVSTQRQRRSLRADHELNRLGKAIVVHNRRAVTRVPYHGIPTMPIPQIVLDLGATGDLELVRFVLAQMDFMRILNVPALERACGQGIAGTAVVREAIGSPQPLFARARSWFEVRLIQVCEQTGIPLPDEVNAKIGDITADAVWWDQMVVVECDGEGNHGTWRQRQRDAANDLTLRGLHFMVIRYTYEQLNDPQAIYDDLMPVLEERRGRAALMRAA